MGMCAIAVADKRTLARSVGKHLTATYGKRAHYSPTLVKVTMRRLKYPDIWDCWALSLFTDCGDFDSYHAALGEICNYAAMNADMLSAVGSDSMTDFLSTDWSATDLFPDMPDLSAHL
jgi:hypothetical protein